MKERNGAENAKATKGAKQPVKLIECNENRQRSLEDMLLEREELGSERKGNNRGKAASDTD